MKATSQSNVHANQVSASTNGLKTWFRVSGFKNMSLAKRMFLSSGLVLCVFLICVALLLSRIFAISLENIVQEKLKLQTYQLLSIGDSGDGSMSLPVTLPESRFNDKSGSLIAFVTKLSSDNKQQVVWRSRSGHDKRFSFPAPESGKWVFGRAKGLDKVQYYVSSYNTTWSNNEGIKAKYIFTVMEELSYYQNQLPQRNAVIVGGLVVFGLVFLMLQAIILRLGLSPVRRIAQDVDAMNTGEIQFLNRQYPKELKPLTANLNQLIDNERHQRERYRDRMADLSHSLKTPLSVLKGVETDIDENGQAISRQKVLNILNKQVKRMSDIVDYQLQRAISNGVPTTIQAVDVSEKAYDILNALNKVYANKKVISNFEIEKGVCFYGDENDLVEIVGNLLDNAFKYSKTRVRFSASKSSYLSQDELQLTFEDDGIGVPFEKRSSILERGIRLDSTPEGQGFGLSIVADIVKSYQGQISIKDSALGGALFNITIPTR